MENIYIHILRKSVEGAGYVEIRKKRKKEINVNKKIEKNYGGCARESELFTADK